MPVSITEYLRQEMLGIGTDPEEFLNEFDSWKSKGPAGEDCHYYFGKDGDYKRPLVDGKRVLRHVHLIPMEESSYMAEWDRSWNRRQGKRVSDTCLVYADAGRQRYLLIAILWEPNAHEVAEMRTPEHADLMHRFATVAAQFIFNGTIAI